jgi:hypothetical protein
MISDVNSIGADRIPESIFTNLNQRAVDSEVTQESLVALWCQLIWTKAKYLFEGRVWLTRWLEKVYREGEGSHGAVEPDKKKKKKKKEKKDFLTLCHLFAFFRNLLQSNLPWSPCFHICYFILPYLLLHT